MNEEMGVDVKFVKVKNAGHRFMNGDKLNSDFLDPTLKFLKESLV